MLGSVIKPRQPPPNREEMPSQQGSCHVVETDVRYSQQQSEICRNQVEQVQKQYEQSGNHNDFRRPLEHETDITRHEKNNPPEKNENSTMRPFAVEEPIELSEADFLSTIETVPSFYSYSSRLQKLTSDLCICCY